MYITMTGLHMPHKGPLHGAVSYVQYWVERYVDEFRTQIGTFNNHPPEQQHNYHDDKQR